MLRGCLTVMQNVCSIVHVYFHVRFHVEHVGGWCSSSREGHWDSHGHTCGYTRARLCIQKFCIVYRFCSSVYYTGAIFYVVEEIEEDDGSYLTL